VTLPKSAEMRSTMTPQEDSAETQQVIFPSDTARGQEVQEQIIERMEQLQFSSRDVFCMRLALAEAVTNAIRHGNRLDPNKQVDISWTVTDAGIRVRIADEGPGFNPEDLVDPTAEENLDRPGGRGIMLIHSFMDSVEYNDRGNVLTIEKQRSVEE